jgi:hypothetical protein
MFLAIDANFRLIRKDVSTEERDPGLGKGYAFYGDVDAYMSHVKRHWNQKQEVCTAERVSNYILLTDRTEESLRRARRSR